MSSSSAVMPGSSPQARAQRRFALVGGSLGNLVEWYDWFVYASFAIYFADSFFPGDNPTTQLMNTAGIFAVGFLMRPVGGWVLGRVREGTLLERVGKQGKWFQVRREGWVPGSAVARRQNRAEAQEPLAKRNLLRPESQTYFTQLAGQEVGMVVPDPGNPAEFAL